MTASGYIYLGIALIILGVLVFALAQLVLYLMYR